MSNPEITPVVYVDDFTANEQARVNFLRGLGIQGVVVSTQGIVDGDTFVYDSELRMMIPQALPAGGAGSPGLDGDPGPPGPAGKSMNIVTNPPTTITGAQVGDSAWLPVDGRVWECTAVGPPQVWTLQSTFGLNPTSFVESYRSTDATPIISSTAFVIDNQVTCTLQANSEYALTGLMLYDGNSQTLDMKCGPYVASGTALVSSVWGLVALGTTGASNVGNTNYATAPFGTSLSYGTNSTQVLGGQFYGRVKTGNGTCVIGLQYGAVSNEAVNLNIRAMTGLTFRLKAS